MLIEVPYNRAQAVAYAEQWALKRNSRYYNFDKIGGDCTNFASQVLFAGCGIMNYDSNGWYYNSVNSRSPSWSGVEFLYNFLINNRKVGPFGERVEMHDIQPGDLVQLSLQGYRFQHCPVIVGVQNPLSYDTIFVSTHTRDVHFYPLSSYKWADIRFIHIRGARKWG